MKNVVIKYGQATAFGLVFLLSSICYLEKCWAEETNEKSAALIWELEKVRNENRGDGMGFVLVRLTNKTDHDVKLDIMRTPLGGMRGDYFSVRENDKVIPYRGALVNRIEDLTPDTLHIINSGQVIERKVNLLEGYNINTPGIYTVQYKEQHIIGHTHSELFVSESKPIEIVVEKPQPYNMLHRTKKKDPVQPCSSEKLKKVRTAQNQAISITSMVNKTLQGLKPENDSIWVKWFGQYNNTRVKRTKRIYGAAEDKLEKRTKSKKINLSCGGLKCNKGDYAYTYTGGLGNNIYLCSEFWKANRGSWNSPGGVILHEVTHFDQVGPTHDYEYGVKKCKNLAKTSPLKASWNADNYQYYGENVIKITP
ncbi:MAG: hypothetical protein D3925_00695 [Candidatus Electrothrix sp. AR5]|nr:hypothetical protein [Candidatus Electrothrix sp. AR5]